MIRAGDKYMNEFISYLESIERRYIITKCRTGSVYIKFYSFETEKWIIVRFSNHKRVYYHENYSIHPGSELTVKKLVNILFTEKI